MTAYPVNFNLSLTSFEPAIKDLRKIIDLALASPLAEPPSILFTSSISVVNRQYIFGFIFYPIYAKDLPQNMTSQASSLKKKSLLPPRSVLDTVNRNGSVKKYSRLHPRRPPSRVYLFVSVRCVERARMATGTSRNGCQPCSSPVFILENFLLLIT